MSYICNRRDKNPFTLRLERNDSGKSGRNSGNGNVSEITIHQANQRETMTGNARKKRIDLPLLVIGLLIAMTVLLFFLDVFVYPFGILLLLIAFFGRLLTLQGPG